MISDSLQKVPKNFETVLRKDNTVLIPFEITKAYNIPPRSKIRLEIISFFDPNNIHSEK
jgi:hypothetical protein